MNKFTITMLSLVGMTGLAFAQAKPADPKAAAPAGAKAADPKAAAPAAKPADPKAAAPAGAKAADPKAGGAAGAPAAPAAKVEPPKPPAEIAATLKQMGTRMNCTGSGLGPDMKTEVKFKGAATNALALDGWWIKGGMTGTMGEGKTAGKMKMDSYMTFDAASKKWRTVGMMNDGTSMYGTAEMKDGKYEGIADMTGPMGSGQFKEHGDMTDPKAGMKMWGEMSPDKGKTWIKVYEMTCKK